VKNWIVQITGGDTVIIQASYFHIDGGDLVFYDAGSVPLAAFSINHWLEVMETLSTTNQEDK